MTKILIITGNYYPRMGGIVTTIRKIAERLIGMGFEITVVTNNEAERQPIKEKIDGIQVIRFDPRFSSLLFGINPSFHSFIKSKPPEIKDCDLVHIHGYHNLLGLQAVYLLRDKPILYSPHYHGVASTKINNYLLKLYKPLGKHIFDYPKKIVCVSKSEAHLVQRDFGVNSDRIQVIGHGIDEKPINHMTRRNNKLGQIRLLYIGQLMEYKGVQHILEAMRSLLDIYGIIAHLDVVGVGDYRERLEQISNKLNINNQITWCGRISDEEKEEKLRNADVFLLISLAEAYGIVVAEALSKGIPCIVANTVALNEFVAEPGCFGIDYPPDPSKLAALIHNTYYSEVAIGPFISGKIRTWKEVSYDYNELYRKTLDHKY